MRKIPVEEETPQPAPDSGSAESSPEPQTTAADTQSEESLMTQLQADLDRFRDLAMRSQADLENYRKRAARDKEDAMKYANLSFLERLIPILDNFELGLSAAKQSAENSPILAGMEMVNKQLQDFLVSSGVEPVNAEGQNFDPNIHEAINSEASADVEEGKVLRQMRKGYKLRERLLRPASVVVSKGAAA